VLQFENGSMTTVQVASAAEESLTLRLVADAGNQTLRISRPAQSEGNVCVEQIALTQP
jgi:cobalamin biosynthesis protein CbiD